MQNNIEETNSNETRTKICKTCGGEKLLSEFAKHKKSKDGHLCECKDCKKIYFIVGIYKIISPNGKIYIGQSKNIKQRNYHYSTLCCKNQPKLYNSLVKYGWENHIHEVIEKCSIEQLNEREEYWGEYYDVLGENGLNCIKVGNSIYDRSPEVNDKISKSLTGGKRSKETRNRMSNSKKNHSMFKTTEWKESMVNTWSSKVSSREIIQYDLDGNFIKEFKSSWEALRELGVSTKSSLFSALNGKAKTLYGYRWRYKDDNKPLEDLSIPKTSKKKGISIIQYDLEDSFIKIWNSTSEINNVLKFQPSPIYSCCEGKSKTAYKYKWKYETDN